jgi:hypothetical protein
MLDRWNGIIRFAVILALLCFAATARAGDDARITYVTGASVYVDLGRDQGLAPGDRLEATRDGEAIATLSVTEVSTNRSSCSVLESSAEPAVGDGVRVVSTAPAMASEEPAKKSRKKLGIRGRVGLQFLAVRDGTSDYGDYSQPALDLRLDAPHLSGGPWGLFVDARARRTYRDLSDGGSDDDSRTRIYRLTVSHDSPEGPWSFVAGRQFSPSLANVAIFDGLSGAYNRERWSVGLFTGSQPDEQDFGYNGDIREHGFYYEFRSSADAEKDWSLTTGVVGSYDSSEVNREFAYLQGRFRGKKLLAYFVQEIDFNRDWKSDEAGESSLEATSSLLSLRYRASEKVSLFGGFDNRRNVRLLRDRETPITEFDDDFRLGVWAGASFRLAEKLSLSLDGRTRGGDDAGDSHAYTVRFGAGPLTKRGLAMHLRSTRYSNPRMDGWLYAVDAGLDVSARVYLQLEAGIRDEEREIVSAFDDSLTWVSLGADISLARRWYLLLALEQTSGDFEDYGQLFTRLSYRF